MHTYRIITNEHGLKKLKVYAKSCLHKWLPLVKTYFITVAYLKYQYTEINFRGYG